jgi:hypothetical protein
MPVLTAGELVARRNARILYAAFLVNQQDLNNKSTVRSMELLESDLVTVATGATFTTYAEQQAIIYNSLTFTIILAGNKLVSGSTSGLTQISFTGIYDAGYGSQAPIAGILDDAFIPIPIGSVFNFFGTNYSGNITWNSNNALVFGTTFSPQLVSVSATTAKSILLGNYDRLCAGIYYSNSTSGSYSITTLIINFCNYYTDPGTPTYKYQIRLIKENTWDQRQFVEVCVVTSPPSPGYSSAAISYPSGTDASGHPIDSNGYVIDQTKASPYNITNGTTFLNPCGTTFSTASPSTGTSFVFSSDSTGTNWTFSNNSYVNV